MKPTLAGAAVAVILATSAWAADPPALNTALRDELARRVKEDQDARTAFIELMKSRNTTDPAKGKDLDQNPAMKKLKDIDKANREWLKGVVEKHGWPGKSLV